MISLPYCGNGVPFSYEQINVYNGLRDPSTMHATDTELSRMFQNYLLQRAMSAYKWTMPESWAENYVLYCLYCWGFFGIINTDKFGVIPQGCSLKGYNVMYQPTNIVVSNPLLRGILEPKIDTQCVLISLQPNYGGIWDLVTFYADMMAMTAATAGSNIMASKLAYVFGSKNKAFAESFKAMNDKIMSGEPSVVVDKNLLTEDGKPTWFTFANNLDANYIAPQLLEDLEKWEKRFDMEIGIPHTNTEKRERLVKGEVNANAQQSYSRAEMWLERLKEGCEKARKMFGIELKVDWRVNPKEMINGGDNNAWKHDTVNSSTV